MEILVLILIGYLLLRKREENPLGKISSEELQTDMSRVQVFWNTIVQESARAGISPCIIMGIIHKESQGDHSLISGKPPTYGLMQLQEKTARLHGLKGSVSNLLNPDINIKVGVTYYAAQVKRYQDWSKAISAYNAGSATTRNKSYVKEVTELSQIYCGLSPSLLTP